MRFSRSRLTKKVNLTQVWFMKVGYMRRDCYQGCVLIADANTLDQIGEIGGYDFPHGIDINYGMIALTSYGNNSISIRPF
jgi:hypothetical protein